MHLDDERRERLIDGELSAAEEAAAREHLATCAECRRALMESEHTGRQSEVLMRQLDSPTPALDLETIVRLASDAEAETRAAVFSAPRPPRFAPRRIAAFALAVALIAAAAYAIPGSPVRRWVERAVQSLGPEPQPSVVSPLQAADGAGIAVTPGESLLIEFVSRQATGLASVSLTEGGEVVVRAPAGAATFASDRSRIVIDNRRHAASFEIEVPRLAPHVEIRIEGRTGFLKEGARVTHAEAVSDGAYRVPLGKP